MYDENVVERKKNYTSRNNHIGILFQSDALIQFIANNGVIIFEMLPFRLPPTFDWFVASFENGKYKQIGQHGHVFDCEATNREREKKSAPILFCSPLEL